MNPTPDSKVDPSQYKGILPAHMRQGIPPYLQILFAARPKLPFVPPIQKPHKIKVQGLFEGVAPKILNKIYTESKINQKNEHHDLPQMSKETFQTALVKKAKTENWKHKLQSHIVRQTEEYHQWQTEVGKQTGNKSHEPRNTLIISKLVV